MEATGQKKKQKKKGKTLNLFEFLGDESSSAQAFKKPVSWADEVEEADEDASDVSSYGAPARRVNRAVLPTAPKAARGPDVNMANVPLSPPYTAFLGNLPYDIDEKDIEDFFRGLSVSNIRLPTTNGRPKGFGYAEFGDRQSLLDALSLNEGTLRNRQIRIDLAEHNQQGGDGKRDSDWRRRDGDGDGGESRSDKDDWRSSGDRSFSKITSERNDRFGDRNDRYGDRNDRYGDRNDRYGDRNDRYGDRNDRFGDRNDRYGDRNDRFGDRNDRYGDRNDRYGDRRYGDRDDGRRSFGSGYRSEDRFASRDIRYTPDGRRDERFAEPRNRSYGGRDERDSEPSDAPRARPRLQLQPRTKPVENEAKSDRSASIFGSAKPVDTAAREREIEERLKKQQEVDHQKVEQEKESRDFERKQRLSSSEDRRRSDSGGELPRRERKTSSSSSGKGIRTVMPPPHAGSSRPRRESDRDHEDVFDDDKAASPKTTPPRKEDVKMVAAPAPKENAWIRRKATPPTSVSKSDSAPTSPTTPSEQDMDRNGPSEGQAEVRSPTGRRPDNSEVRPNAWGRGGSGAAVVSGRGRGSYNQSGRDEGRGRGRGSKDREKPVPKSIDEMPKYEEKTKKKKVPTATLR